MVKDTYCGDLMDLAAGPDGPPYHPNENAAGEHGDLRAGGRDPLFLCGEEHIEPVELLAPDVERAGVGRRTNAISEAMASPCEWSVLPDAGRNPGDLGDILLVDDADDRGGPAQLYFDWAFKLMNMEDRVDRFDVLGPSSVVANSLAGRVKNIRNADHRRPDGSLSGDPLELLGPLAGSHGRRPVWRTAGSSAEKSDDFHSVSHVPQHASE